MNISHWIRHLFDADPAGEPTEAVARGVEHAVELIDPKLRLVPGYFRRLAEPVEKLLAHAEAFAREVPGPVTVSRRAYAVDPLVHALFGAVGELPNVFGRSRALRALIEQPERIPGPDLYALLGVRREQKSVLGMDLQGEVIRCDVPQVMVYFKDHTLTDPAPTELAARQGLARQAFESIALRAADEIKALREQRSRIEGDRSVLRARLRGNHPEPELAPQIERMDEQLRELHALLELPACLERAARMMIDPGPWLRLEHKAVTITRMGIEAAAGSDEPADTVHFPELVARDRRRWVVLLVSYPIEELPPAHTESEATRWITI